MAKNIKKLTLLHSNDMHGDFLAEKVDNRLVGGVSLLSGYINKVRSEEKNVIYAVAGDMFRGSIIDSEFKGISTIQIANALSPDIMTLGNHEVDYGLTHLLFLEKCANFPIINANIYIKTNNSRLFKPYKIIEIDGMRILFIGILTEQVLDSFKKDKLISTLINTSDAAEEVQRIVNAHASVDIDFTVLLTHIGFEEDIKLAKLLDPECGVDVIIGGHTHTVLEKPEIVNGIPIVQAGTGTDFIGRFDIDIDTDNNCIDSFTWQMVPISEDTCPWDDQLETVLTSFKSVTDDKYSRIITRFSRELTHPVRNAETELGDLFADIIKHQTGADIAFMASGGIRCDKLGPIVTLGDLAAAYPYSEGQYMLTVDGAMLRSMMEFMLREVPGGAHIENYQINRELKAVYSNSAGRLVTFSYDGKNIEDSDRFKVCFANYHYQNLEKFTGLSPADQTKYGKPRLIATNDFEIVEEFMNEHTNLDAHVEGRWYSVD